MGIPFEDVETEIGGYWASREGVKEVVMYVPFPNAGYGSGLEIPPMIPSLLTGSFPTKERVILLAVFVGLPLIMGMLIRGKYRLRMLIPGVPTAT